MAVLDIIGIPFRFLRHVC